MVRWIVAGVLVVVLVVLLVSGGGGAGVGAPDGAGADEVREDYAAPDGEAAQAAAREEAEGLASEQAELAELEALVETCRPLEEQVEAAFGAEMREQLGTTLQNQKGMTYADISALCTRLEGRPIDQVAQELREITGLELE